jgi:transcriptional regulator with XRE-family HTH domain
MGTRSASTILKNRYRDTPNFHQHLAEERVNAEIAYLLRDVRLSAALTQSQLADMIGTTQSVIARLEDADYDGHSLSMIKKIGEALGKRLEVRLVPKEMDPSDSEAAYSA